MNNEKTKPRNVGPGPRVAEKPKDLKVALSKMVKYLKSFVPFIIVALILSVLSSIFSIIGPNKLSDLTDKISSGIVLDKDKFVTITTQIQDEMTSDKINNVSKEIISSDLNNDSIINNVVISSKDKNDFILLLNKLNNKEIEQKGFILNIPSSVKESMMSDSKIDGSIISAKDKVVVIDALLKADEKDSTSIYSAIDKMPKSVYNLIKPHMDMKGIIKIVIFLGVLYLLSALFNFAQSFIMATVSNNFAKELRTKI